MAGLWMRRSYRQVNGRNQYSWKIYRGNRLIAKSARSFTSDDALEKDIARVRSMLNQDLEIRK